MSVNVCHLFMATTHFGSGPVSRRRHDRSMTSLDLSLPRAASTASNLDWLKRPSGKRKEVIMAWFSDKRRATERSLYFILASHPSHDNRTNKIKYNRNVNRGGDTVQTDLVSAIGDPLGGVLVRDAAADLQAAGPGG